MTTRPKMDKQGHKAWEQEVGSKWHALTQHERDKWYLEEKAKGPQGESLPDAHAVLEEKLKGILLGVADSEFPLGLRAFEDTIRRELQLGDGEPLPGFTRYSKHLRSAYAARGFIEDHGDIPKSRKFSPHLPCHVAHPGVCRAECAPFLGLYAKLLQVWQHCVL